MSGAVTLLHFSWLLLGVCAAPRAAALGLLAPGFTLPEICRVLIPFLLSIARVSPEVAREQPSASPEGKPNEQVLFVANWVDSLLNLGA